MGVVASNRKGYPSGWNLNYHVQHPLDEIEVSLMEPDGVEQSKVLQNGGFRVSSPPRTALALLNPYRRRSRRMCCWCCPNSRDDRYDLLPIALHVLYHWLYMLFPWGVVVCSSRIYGFKVVSNRFMVWKLCRTDVEVSETTRRDISDTANTEFHNHAFLKGKGIHVRA